MGCSDVDPHIPRERFDASARVLREMGADVRDTLYPGFGHTVNQHELDQIQHVLHPPLHSTPTPKEIQP
jgi:predicted esterase